MKYEAQMTCQPLLLLKRILIYLAPHRSPGCPRGGGGGLDLRQQISPDEAQTGSAILDATVGDSVLPRLLVGISPKFLGTFDQLW